jgi:uncharacterized coiled-coil protein SlyX
MFFWRENRKLKKKIESLEHILKQRWESIKWLTRHRDSLEHMNERQATELANLNRALQRRNKTIKRLREKLEPND